MTSKRRRDPPTPRPLSNLTIALGAAVVLGIGMVVGIALLRRYGNAEPQIQLDAIRTAGTLLIGTGGFAALLLAARRQRSTELTLEHQREVAQATERDAAEQRLTELYTRAVDQLGNGQAPVRLGGLHALERVAQGNPAQRQTIVDVICAYLRMPFTPPGDQTPGEDAPEDAHRRYDERRQELQVRFTAQRILTAHLKPEAAAVFWADIDLDLTQAHLRTLDLTHCHVRTAQFDGAQFAGLARFTGASFSGRTGFAGATFAEDAMFVGAEFAGDASFAQAQFVAYARFNRAQFIGNVWFEGARFDSYAWFDKAQFGHAWFDKAQFTAYAGFNEAQFTEHAWFAGAKFPKGAGFTGARLTSGSQFDLPAGWTARAAVSTDGEDESWLYVVREDGGEHPAEAPSREEDPS